MPVPIVMQAILGVLVVVAAVACFIGMGGLCTWLIVQAWQAASERLLDMTVIFTILAFLGICLLCLGMIVFGLLGVATTYLPGEIL